MQTTKSNYLLAAGVLASLVPSVAHAEGETPLEPLDPVRIVSPLTIVQGDGIKVGEGSAIYPQVGLETGFVSNTFFSADDQIPAGILRLLVEVGIGSLSMQRRTSANEERPAVGAFEYNIDAYAAYDQYLSSNGNVTDQGGLGFGVNARAIINPQKPVSFGATERFDRILRATNYESRTNANRDINTLSLKLDIQPETSSIGGSIGYVNQIDVFEQESENFANRMKNTLQARLNYRFFPLSVAFLEVDQGFTTGLGSDSTKVDSYPLRAFVGVSTALTVSTALIAELGYTQGFYAAGPDYQAPMGGVYLEHHYSDYGAIRLKYQYEHNDSINANFYADHVIQGWLEHRVKPFALFISPEVRFRTYEGLNGPLMGELVRKDLIFAAAVGARYQFRESITGSAEYRFITDQTDYRYTGGASMLDPSFVRHELFVGVRVAY